jgi:hypothetical protein
MYISDLPSYALLSYALLSYALPQRALTLIHEYSRPITRPDWRKSRPIITTYELYLQVRSVYLCRYIQSNRMVDFIILRNIKHTNWFQFYSQKLM